jgi:GTP-binding protein HflX
MTEHTIEGPPPFAILAAVQLKDVSDAELAESQDELGRLAKTLGLEVIGRISQKRSSFDRAAYLGPGKREELKALIEASAEEHPDRDHVVLVDHEISPSQARELAKATGAEVLDRKAVILEIFQRHAKSRAARVQVEIVRLAYMAPRMRDSGRKGGAGRQRGGIGGKGAGESSMELDRRKVRDRIAELRSELERIEGERRVQRARRQDLRRVALVGYTNAGKSTLMRALTGSEIYIADKLFATLETTVRALQPDVEPRILVSDTVGFIRKLPHDLVSSFKSTLDEALEASLLLHVVDASDPAFRSHMATTEAVLAEIGAEGIATTLVLNKVDQVEDPEARELLVAEFPSALLLSAKSEEDVARLREHILAHFGGGLETAWLEIPHEQGEVRAKLLATCEVTEESYDERGGRYHVRGTAQAVQRIRELLDPI